MGPLTVILGSLLKGEEKSGIVRIVTPKGDVLCFNESDVVTSSSVDASGELRRYAIPADANVTIEVTGAALRGLDVTVDSVLKWVDDGGTISKSRDDLS
ncbi:hypothetical protein [Affinirhizobium pseudoryzae]|uniref:hypothetical protein n=1 Tax=Allorhizobium pseudoryzae TaxID=379684 RepID=UPI0013E9ECB3|nr:hypothetical protein [Allorhizobium pseudoryzae]